MVDAKPGATSISTSSSTDSTTPSVTLDSDLAEEATVEVFADSLLTSDAMDESTSKYDERGKPMVSVGSVCSVSCDAGGDRSINLL